MWPLEVYVGPYGLSALSFVAEGVVDEDEGGHGFDHEAGRGLTFRVHFR